MNQRHWLRATVLSLAAAVWSLPAAAQEVDIPHEVFTLDNGLTVVVHEDRKAPIVAVSVWYHVGSKDEKPGKTGFAHLFEHLMFQGSENYPDEYFKPFEQVGATDMNGTTWLDRTNYFQTVPTTALDMALWMESDRMGHFLGAVTQELLDEQRGVVQNEKRQGDNQPYGKVFETVQWYSFPAGHPYRWETIGSMEDLNAASLDDVKQWFREYYGPNNAVLVLAGDIDLATARQKAAQYFGDIPAGPPVTRPESWVAPRTHSSRAVMQDRIAQVRLYKSWNVAPRGTADANHLGLLGNILGGGKTSRLYERLVYREQLADGVAAYAMPFELAGLFWIQADVKQGVDPARVEAIIGEELERLLVDGPTEDELERAKTDVRAGWVRGIEKVGGFGGKATVLAECQVYEGDAGCFRESLARYESATAGDVARAGRAWLAQGDFTLVLHPFPQHATAESGVDRTAGIPAVEQFPDLSFPALQRSTLSNGVEVVLAERHETPIVNVELMFDAGYAADMGSKLGTSSFVMGMLDEGTTSRSALEIAAEAEALGAQLWSGSGLDYSDAGVSALTDKLAPSLDLLADIVRNPAFEEKEIARVRAQWLAGIAREKTQPVALAQRVLPPLLYGEGHAYAIPLTGSGTEASITALTREDLLAFHRQWLRPDRMRILVAGDTTLEQILPLLEQRFGNWTAEGEAPAKNIAPVALPEAPRVFLMDKPGAVQTILMAGQLLPPTTDARNLAIETMNDVFGGMFTARLNMNLREDKSWAYGAYSFSLGALGQRPLLVYAPVQTDRTVDSIREIRRELAEYTGEKPATAEEIEKIRVNSIRSLPGRYETAASVLNAIESIELYDRPDDWVQTTKQRIEALTDQQVRDATEVLAPGSLTWVIVGDLSEIEAPIRELGLGEVKVIDSDGTVLR